MISTAAVGRRERANTPSLKAGILVMILSEDSNPIHYTHVMEMGCSLFFFFFFSLSMNIVDESLGLGVWRSHESARAWSSLACFALFFFASGFWVWLAKMS